MRSRIVALLFSLLPVAAACGASVAEVTRDADEIARVIEGTWSCSPEIMRAHLPAADTTDLSAHAMSLVLDESAREGVSDAALMGMRIVSCGQMSGGSKPHRFFLGDLGGRAYLLFLSEGINGDPLSDSDGGFVTLRRGATDVLCVDIDATPPRAIAYERS